MNKKEKAALDLAIKLERDEKRKTRNALIDAMANFDRDIEAISRVNQINGIETDDDKLIAETLERYSLLKEYGYNANRCDRVDVIQLMKRDFFWAMRRTRNYYQCPSRFANYDHLEHGLLVDDFWLDDGYDSTAYNLGMVAMAQIFGYDRIVFTNNSTNAMKVLSDLIQFGCKVVEANRKSTNGGVVLSIEDVQVDVCIVMRKETEKYDLFRRYAEYGTSPNQEKIDETIKPYDVLLEMIRKDAEEVKL